MSRTHLLIACGLVLGAAACVDRPAPVATDDGTPGVAGPVAAPGTAGPRPERLARLFAVALRSPGFRDYLKNQLDASPFPEHKIQLQRFLGAPDGRALRDVAELNGTTEADVAQEARAAIPLEVYLPVPAHRAAWSGGENGLVARRPAGNPQPRYATGNPRHRHGAGGDRFRHPGGPRDLFGLLGGRGRDVRLHWPVHDQVAFRR